MCEHGNSLKLFTVCKINYTIDITKQDTGQLNLTTNLQLIWNIFVFYLAKYVFPLSQHS